MGLQLQLRYHFSPLSKSFRWMCHIASDLLCSSFMLPSTFASYQLANVFLPLMTFLKLEAFACFFCFLFFKKEFLATSICIQWEICWIAHGATEIWIQHTKLQGIPMAFSIDLIVLFWSSSRHQRKYIIIRTAQPQSTFQHQCSSAYGAGATFWRGSPGTLLKAKNAGFLSSGLHCSSIREESWLGLGS